MLMAKFEIVFNYGVNYLRDAERSFSIALKNPGGVCLTMETLV